MFQSCILRAYGIQYKKIKTKRENLIATIYPSLISANLLHLAQDIEDLDPHCGGYHIDIMDNHFVPNLTWGHQFTNAIASKSTHPIMWVHLMVTDPGSFLGRFNIRPESIVSFHLEVNIDVLRLVNDIKLKEWRPSIALKPQTAVEDVFPFLDVVDHVLVMSVEPGFSGQPFIEDSIEKIKALDTYRKETGRSVTIGIDGGITKDNIEKLVTLGVEDIAAASSIFNKYSKPVEALQELNNLIKK